MKQKVHAYDGADATVTWDQRRCIHFEACVHGLPRVFDPDRRPWIEPDRDGPDEPVLGARRPPGSAWPYCCVVRDAATTLADARHSARPGPALA